MVRLFCLQKGGYKMEKLKGKFTTILNKIITDKSISGNEFRILASVCIFHQEKTAVSVKNIALLVGEMSKALYADMRIKTAHQISFSHRICGLA